MGDLVAQLQALKDKAKAQLSKIMAQAQKAAMSFDTKKATELKAEAAAETRKANEEQSGLTKEIQGLPASLKKDTCDGGKAVPNKFTTCLGYLSGNVIYTIFAP